MLPRQRLVQKGYGFYIVHFFRRVVISIDSAGRHSNGLGFCLWGHGIHRDLGTLVVAKESALGGNHPYVLDLDYRLKEHHGHIYRCHFVDPLCVAHGRNLGFVGACCTQLLDYPRQRWEQHCERFSVVSIPQGLKAVST